MHNVANLLRCIEMTIFYIKIHVNDMEHRRPLRTLTHNDMEHRQPLRTLAHFVIKSLEDVVRRAQCHSQHEECMNTQMSCNQVARYQTSCTKLMPTSFLIDQASPATIVQIKQ